MDSKFYAGAARADITPPIGTKLYGYAPDVVSTSVHDPLDITAVAFRQGNDTVVLYSVTVGDFQTELSNNVRSMLGEMYSIPASNLIIAATHTHSAPNVAGMAGWGDIDREYVDSILIPAFIKVTADALGSLEEAEIAVSVVESKVGINRREHKRDNSITFGQNPWGCFDPNMTLIALRRVSDKKGIVNIIHYGCHGTAAGRNHEISRDWSGIMVDRLENVTGILTTYINGSLGDVGPRLTNGGTTGDIRYVEELGGVAALDAYTAYRALGTYTPGKLSVVAEDIKIPFKTLPTLEDVQKKLAEYVEPEKLINLSQLEYTHYKSVEEVYLSGADHLTDYIIPQTVFSIGNVVMVPMPFEIFSETSLRLRKYSPLEHTLVLSNANGYNAYLPTEDQLCRGGYEVGCFLYSGTFTLVNNADQVVIEENLRLIEKL